MQASREKLWALWMPKFGFHYRMYGTREAARRAAKYHMSTWKVVRVVVQPEKKV